MGDHLGISGNKNSEPCVVDCLVNPNYYGTDRFFYIQLFKIPKIISMIKTERIISKM